MKKSVLALALLSMLSILLPLHAADVNVLIIGSERDSGERHYSGWWWDSIKPVHVPDSAPFSPAKIGTELKNILAQAGVGTVNVQVKERYATDYATPGWPAYSYNLATWFHWPFPAGSESNRWADLRCEAGTDWDYIILIGDPYTMEYTPGMYTHGVAKIAEEVAKGSAETVLLMPWPAPGSSSSVDHYKEVVYRTGRTGGLKVVPAGLAWRDAGSPTGTTHPSSDGAYIAAASIYSRLWGKNARISNYTYNDTLADKAYATVTSNIGKQQYSGKFSFQNPYLLNDDHAREIHMSEHGTSTEDGFKYHLRPAIQRCGVAYIDAYYNDKYYDATPEDDNRGWPAAQPMPISFNYGRDGMYSEDSKSYEVNTNYWKIAFGYYYQFSADSLGYTTEQANDAYIGLMQLQDHDLANRMINEQPSARNVPVRTLWAAIHKENPLLHPQEDSTHLIQVENEAVASYMYTLYSGRCPVDIEPASPDITWKAAKIGYEAAWHLGTCSMRAPGFKVMPEYYALTNVSPTNAQTLSVQFVNAPTSDVTVAVAVDDIYIGRVSPAVLTFTPANYSVAQTVTVLGESGPAGSFEFNVILMTSSADPAYDGVGDSWNFCNTRPEGPIPTDIRIFGNSTTIISGDTEPDAGDGTDFGPTTGSVTHTFTIKNISESEVISLTGSPKRVALNDPSGFFALTQDASVSTLPAGSSTTFKISYTPSAEGIHTAQVSVASTDSVLPLYTFAICGVSPYKPAVAVLPSSATTITSAEISGVLSGGGAADGWLVWGDNDAGTSGISSWDNVVSLGTVNEGDVFKRLVSGLSSNTTYFYRCYVTNVYGSAWSVSAEIFSGTPAVGNGLQTMVVGVNFRRSTGETEMPPSDSAGAVLSSANWNNTDGTNVGGTANIVSPASAKLVDGNGNNTSLNITWSFSTTWSAANSGSADNRMMSGYLDNTGGDKVITVTNIAASSYSVYAYVGSGSDGRTGTIGIDGEETYSFMTASQSKNFPGAYIQTTDTGTAYPYANYAVWTNLSGAGFSLRHTRGNNNSGVHGIQIVCSAASEILNESPESITGSSATLNGHLNAAGTNYSVYVYWGESDGGSNASSWANSAYVGSWAGLSTNVSYNAVLAEGQTYYYTFMASNAAKVVWANPSWRFMTPAEDGSVGTPAVTYDIAAIAGIGGSISPEGTVSVTEGQSQDYKITADTGYHIADVLVDGVSVGAVAGYQFSNVTSGHTISASFAEDQVAGVWTPAEMATVAWFDAADADTVILNGSKVSRWVDKSGNGNDAVQASVANQPAYQANDPMVNGMPSIGDISASGQIGLKTPSVTAKTVYAVAYYKDGVDADFDGYSTLFSGPGRYGTYRVMGTVNSSALIGTYSFSSAGIFKNGSVSSSATILPLPCAILKFKANTAITQVYAFGYNQLDASRDWQGAYCEWVFTDGTEGADTEQKIEGYLAHKWGLAVSLPADHPYKDVAPGGTPAVTYDITATAGVGGSISPEGTVSVTEGDSQSYTITADAGYHIADVLVDGVSVGAVAGYQFSNVTAPHTIAAVFEADPVPWTPAEMTTVAWFDAADADTVILNGSKVSRWVDKSGNGNHAEQLSAANQPTYQSSDPMVNNMPSIGDISASGQIGLKTPSMTAKTVYAVAYYKDGVDADFDGYSTLFSGPGRYGTYRVMGTVNSSALIGTYSFSSAGIFKNGSVSSSATILPLPCAILKFKANTAITQVYALGYNQLDLARDWQGAYCEWVFTDGTEDAATEQKIEGYLAHKWGLAASLPADHPYKDAAPEIQAAVKAAPAGDSDVLVKSAAAAEEFTSEIVLLPGMNLVSLPLTPFETNAAALFGTAEVFEMDAAGEYIPAETVGAGRGYWVRVDDVVALSIPGSIPEDTTVELQAGWNLFGLKGINYPDGISLKDLSGADALLGGGLRAWDASVQQYKEVDALIPGEGYSVFCEGPLVIVFP